MAIIPPTNSSTTLAPGEVLILHTEDIPLELVDGWRATLDGVVGAGRWLVVPAVAGIISSRPPDIEVAAFLDREAAIDPGRLWLIENHLGALIARMSNHIDNHNGAKSSGHLLRIRTGKLAEALGEVEELLVELEDSNPRKQHLRRPDDDIVADLRRELLDVAVTALGAIAHTYHRANEGIDVGELLAAHVRIVVEDMGLE